MIDLRATFAASANKRLLERARDNIFLFPVYLLMGWRVEFDYYVIRDA